MMVRQVEKACMHTEPNAVAREDARSSARVMLPVAHHTPARPNPTLIHLSKMSCVPQNRELGAGSWELGGGAESWS